MAVVEIEQLHYAYPSLLPEGEPIPVLHGIDLAIERGEFLAIMGPTGVGKSTLCMAMNGIVPRSTGGVIRGSVRVLGRDTRRVPVAELAVHVGIVYQDPESQLFSATVEDEVAFGPQNLGIDAREIAERITWALALVDMSAYRSRLPAQLSGGQKQRVAIAASLAMLPQVLILDEPTAGLDPAGQFEVFSAIERLGRERNMTIVMVSQDAEHIAQFAHRLALLWQGRIARLDTPLRVFEDVALLREVGIASPQVTEVAVALNAKLGAHFHFVGLDDAASALTQSLPPAGLSSHLPSLPPSGPPPTCEDAFSPYGRSSALPAQPAICISGLVYHYEDTPALNGVDLVVPDNDWLAIVGQNGSGKTTLVKHMNGLLKPIAGRVCVYGVDTAAASVDQLARTVGYVFQNPDHQIFNPTTRQEISFGPRNLGLAAGEVERLTQEALETFHLVPYAETPPAVLGFGLRRLVSIAAVYAMRPRVFILDEPTAGLDWRSTVQLMDHITRLHAEGHTIILVTHDMRLVAEYAGHVLVMHEGRILAQGSPREAFSRAQELAQAQLRPPQVMQLGQRLVSWGLSPSLLTVGEFVAAYAQAKFGPAMNGVRS